MSDWLERGRGLAERPWVGRAGRVLRWLFFAGMFTWLVLKVRAIGWQDVWAALPTTPWFYLLFLAMFFALPVSETLVFRLLLGRSLPGSLPVFVRKRVFNSAFVGYSGEVYLFAWARRRLGIASRTMLLVLKDNAILSALASAAVTSVLLMLFVATGQVRWLAHWLDSAAGLLLAGGLTAAFLVPIAIRLRRRILSVRARTALSVLGLHVARIGVVVLLQASQWAVALPTEPWSVWLTFLTLQMVISRLPFVPNRDLLFLSAGLEMSHVVEGPRAAMAGLLFASAALTQGTNLLFFLLTSFESRRGLQPPEQEAALDPDLRAKIIPPLSE